MIVEGDVEDTIIGIDCVTPEDGELVLFVVIGLKEVKDEWDDCEEDDGVTIKIKARDYRKMIGCDPPDVCAWLESPSAGDDADEAVKEFT